MSELSDKSQRIRRNVIKSIYNAGSGHFGSSLSCVDILNAIYAVKGTHDKVILSKGHAAPALYATMAEYGEIKEKELMTLRKVGSKLQGHPDKRFLRQLDAGTGALGQGLSIAAGYALASKLLDNENRVYCIVGDGECQEGQIWEAVRSIREMNLDNLTCVVDSNNFQNEGEISMPHKYFSLNAIFGIYGWVGRSIDGHSLTELQEALTWEAPFPNFVIATTVKGKGVSFMENDNYWHGGVMMPEQYAQALEELNCKS